MYKPFVAEFLGTFMLVMFGIGSVSAVVLIGALTGLWEIAIVWGFGISLAIYATASVSGAHLNPALSLTMAIWHNRTGFTFTRAAGYIIAQVLGGIAAGCVNLSIYEPFITDYESRTGIIRGEAGSERSAMDGALAGTLLGPTHALFVEAFGAGVLAFMAFALTDPGNRAIPRKELAPCFIGLTAASLIALLSPITQASFNPARDLGPRIVAALAGWGSIAMPGARSGFWVYIVGPCIGAPIGATVYLLLLEKRREMPSLEDGEPTR
ncbi:glycerol uptake facilitator protein [Blyttiomyces helicus]|uniref:Glycerol uptake facilitator protein n=1 Tax=Blyttiomyces helicus TaxID=388810 RepID=A0A4P9WKW2_9FUNG|nr:glycerol uptake facilitator protein [Blyttiomyces helicus]|eukprot:RKO92673.1 glycerol uptake facilitator protein [Blyttiomyces helicus]